MALLQGYKKDDTIYVKYNGKIGRFVQTVPLDTEGAVIRTKKDSSEKVAELFYSGVSGLVNGIKLHHDDKYNSDSINIAFKDPGEPTTVVTFPFKGENGINKSVVQMLQALNSANMRNMLRVTISHKEAGSKFVDKNGVEQVREFAQSTIFVAPRDGDKDSWIRVNFDEIPKPEPVIHNGKQLMSGTKAIMDESKLEEYGLSLIASIQEKLEEIRNADKAALNQAPGGTPAENNEQEQLPSPSV